MPYPSQTDADEIRAVALELLATQGEDKVTVRGVAKQLHLTPNALYRYYQDRDALLAELASEGARQLLGQLEAVTENERGRQLIYILADAYVAFALEREALYRLMMRKHSYTFEQEQTFAELWSFVKRCVAKVGLGANVEETSVSLWGFLHGMVGLEQADVFHEGKPKTGVRSGLEALLLGFST